MAHVDLDNLTAIKLLFLPPNTTALAQPLDQGIIRSVKQTYRKNLLRRMLLVMDSGKTYTIDLLGAVHLLAHSWREVQPATIQNCFARAQFKILEGDDDADGEDAEDCENLLVEVLERQGAADEEVNFGTFRDVDGDVTTSPDFSDSDIVAAVAPRPASSESEEDSDVEVDDGPSLSDAARAVAVMRAFAEKRGLMDKLAAGLADFEDAVVAARPPRRQVKITDFLLPASE
ncbi:jerky protein homolog-like [Dermacentor silvarum]|uniref:jerky protein homolog-like n=1 Tax=Dermacentor silvarum TaxID=543639 RepID=UPI0018979480|nr:jerky protein homolog-like [Dermacentor silvarum]